MGTNREIDSRFSHGLENPTYQCYCLYFVLKLGVSNEGM
jgi:hypothetical protein